MQGSAPRTRNTLPARAARNRDGTVSRFLASSECSKVPWKAKAHVGRRREFSRSRVVEWEEPRHPGPASRNGTYPTLSHSATQISTFAPLDLILVTLRTSIPPICRRFAAWADPCAWRTNLQDRL